MRVRQLLILAVSALFVGAATTQALAQGTRVKVDRSGVRVETGAKGMRHTDGAVVRSKDLVGLTIYNSDNENLGTIEEIVLDPGAGKIRYAVLSFGGVLGIGDKLFAVPWNQLSFVPKGTTTAGTQKGAYRLLDLSKETLKEAPGFDKSNWPNFADNNWNATVDQYYEKTRQAAGERTRRR